MGIKTSYQVFFAIPFDTATREMYERIGERIRQNFGVTTIIGTKMVQPSRLYSDIATFKAQNTEMITDMRLAIERADIIVADMTHNNPNVHFELGIALYLNKNILRVTGRTLTELGFDVRGLEVYLYKDEETLLKNIEKYLELFLRIKDLSLSDASGPFYRRRPDQTIRANETPRQLKVERLDFQMRDGAVSAIVTFNAYQDSDDWFGFYFRNENVQFASGYLVYVRQKGSVEIAAYPGTRIILCEPLVCGEVKVNCEKTFLVELDGDTARVTIDGTSHICDRLTVQNQGNVCIAAHGSEVTFRNIEVVCRDTINPYPQERSRF